MKLFVIPGARSRWAGPPAECVFRAFVEALARLKAARLKPARRLRALARGRS